MTKVRSNRAKRPNQTGRSDKGSRFVALPYRVLDSAAFASLDLTGRAVLTELVMLFNGDNNGSLYLSADDARLRLGLADKRPVLRAFDQLAKCGLIELTKEAHFDVKVGEASRARCWRVAWLVWPESPSRSKRAPTYGWEQYEATGNRADRRLRALAKFRKAAGNGKFPGVKFTPLEAKLPKKLPGAGEYFTPAIAANDANQPTLVGGDFTPYIDSTMYCWWNREAEMLTRGPYLLLTMLGKLADQSYMAA